MAQWIRALALRTKLPETSLKTLFVYLFCVKKFEISCSLSLPPLSCPLSFSLPLPPSPSLSPSLSFCYVFVWIQLNTHRWKLLEARARPQSHSLSLLAPLTWDVMHICLNQKLAVPAPSAGSRDLSVLAYVAGVKSTYSHAQRFTYVFKAWIVSLNPHNTGAGQLSIMF